jgi:hypothetical protein
MWRRAVRRVEPCEGDGEVMCDGRTSELLFPPAEVAAYISTLITLDPVTCCSQWEFLGVCLLPLDGPDKRPGAGDRGHLDEGGFGTLAGDVM